MPVVWTVNEPRKPAASTPRLQLAASRGLQTSPLREQAFSAISREECPLTAYELREKLIEVTERNLAIMVALYIAEH